MDIPPTGRFPWFRGIRLGGARKLPRVGLRVVERRGIVQARIVRLTDRARPGGPRFPPDEGMETPLSDLRARDDEGHGMRANPDRDPVGPRRPTDQDRSGPIPPINALAIDFPA